MSRQVTQYQGYVWRNPLTSEDALIKAATVDMAATYKSQAINEDGSEPSDAQKLIINRNNAFQTRFGLAYTKKLNQDMKETIFDPADKLTKINEEYDNISMRMANLYKLKYDEFTAAGLAPKEAGEASDAYITPLLASEIEAMKIKFPYSYSGGAIVSEMIDENYQRWRGAKFFGRNKRKS